LLAASLAAGCADRQTSPLEHAQAVVRDSANFTTGREAGDTMVRAADYLLAQARQCIDDHGETPYCLAFRAAAAWSNVAGVRALSCRAPGRFVLQRRATKFYAELGKLKPNLRDIPRNPPLPNCE
jgi:hypothetical protein